MLRHFKEKNEVKILENKIYKKIVGVKSLGQESDQSSEDRARMIKACLRCPSKPYKSNLQK